MIDAEQRIERGRRRERQLAADGIGLFVADLVARKAVGILTGIFIMPPADPDREHILNDRQRHGARNRALAAARNRDRRLACQLIAGLGRDVIDRTGISRATIECRLWSLDHFDALGIVENKPECCVAHEHTVDED